MAPNDGRRDRLGKSGRVEESEEGVDEHEPQACARRGRQVRVAHEHTAQLQRERQEIRSRLRRSLRSARSTEGRTR